MRSPKNGTGNENRDGCLILARLDVAIASESTSAVLSHPETDSVVSPPRPPRSLRSLDRVPTRWIVEKVFHDDDFWRTKLRQSVYHCTSILMDPTTLESMEIQF